MLSEAKHLIGCPHVLKMHSCPMYAKYCKRPFDLVFALLALVVFSPVLLALTIAGMVAMRGNPFFVQERPGLHEKIFKLVKFRTMTNARDAAGNLLPDEARLNAYGKFLRATSLDELPELVNIVKGDMSLVGPRPLLVRYLPRYDEAQRHRHDVRPGLTGYAQVHGRNVVSWEEKFKLDIWYLRNISFKLDLKILILTIKLVIKQEGISSESSATMEEFIGNAIDEKYHKY